MKNFLTLSEETRIKKKITTPIISAIIGVCILTMGLKTNALTLDTNTAVFGGTEIMITDLFYGNSGLIGFLNGEQFGCAFPQSYTYDLPMCLLTNTEPGNSVCDGWLSCYSYPFSGDLVLIETYGDGVCGDMTQSECEESEYFVDKKIVTVSRAEAAISTPAESGVVNFPPELKLMTEISGVCSKELPIYYSASDPNSGDRGLRDLPIDIFYSNDKGISWKELAKDQPNTGVYAFNTTKVSDGADYKIRIVATDWYEYFAEAISKIFSIDNSGPSFDISISPFLVKEKDTIVLKIISSEALKTPPELRITQKDAQSKIVAVSGSGKEFSASYDVIRGYPGKAIISISGKDLVGNIGEIITSGKAFSVERFGPPPPTINEPINNQVFTQPTIKISGTTQPNIEVALLLNGITGLTTRSLADGSFEIDDIPLSLTAVDYGNNILSITAINEKGEESEEVVLKVKLNSPPKILITSVFEKIISGDKEINWVTSDLNDDKLVFSIEYSNDGGISWDYIVSDFFEPSYKIDTTQLADGPNYLIRVTADDGTEKVSDISKRFTIKNNLPHISLDIPSNYFTNINIPTLTGKVTGSEQNITLVEYSFDGGTIWRSAIALDGRFDSIIEKIKIPISEPLKDGKYTILIRARDTLNRSVKISRSFNVDTIPPVLEFPLLDKIVDNSMDGNLELGGLQIIFPGRTEPKAKIELILGDKIYKTISDEKGEFEVKNVTLLLHGPNKISLTSSDLAGNITKIIGEVISNNPPQISISNPNEGEFLGGVKEITWKAQDSDNDPIVSQIFYQKKDKKWITLIKNLASQGAVSPNVYKWDISKIANGNYEIKIVVSDGMSETGAILNIFIDNIAPQATLDISGSLSTNNTQPKFSGRTSDDFSGIQDVEYSFDNIDWYEALIIRGYQTLKANFEIRHRFPLTDGNYQLGVRVSDLAGNLTYLTPLDLTIDTTPPRIGSNLISSEALILFPDETGAIKLFEDTPYRISVSVAGDAKEVSLKAKETTFDFNLNKATFLWESEFNFKDSGEYSLLISARDEAGNSQTKEIAALSVIPRGSIYNGKTNERIKEAKITLYFFDQNTNSWLIWDAQAFGQKNPQETDATGEYGFLVPPGKYQLEVSCPGFKTIGSEELEIKKNYLINVDISLTEKKGIFNKVLDYFLQFYEKI